jgi:hypothetical protein
MESVNDINFPEVLAKNVFNDIHKVTHERAIVCEKVDFMKSHGPQMERSMNAYDGFASPGRTSDSNWTLGFCSHRFALSGMKKGAPLLKVKLQPLFQGLNPSIKLMISFNFMEI